MKKKLIALVCALALAVGLVGCSLSTPDSVGTIGDMDISSGLYLLAQFDAYQTAADLASDDQDATKVSSFLKATITVDDATGETAVVSDYVAQKTLENLESYAAIETRFDELGGVLTLDEETQADSYASQLMEQNGDLYKANGIGLDTLKRFERILIKSNDLLEMCYGIDGETPVSDAELTSHLEDEMVYIRYVVVPLYNTSTFAFADDAQSTQMLELAQTAAESCNAAIPDGASAQTSAFSAAVAAALPDIYAVLDGEPSSDASSLSTALLGSDNIDSTFSEEGSADAVRALHPDHVIVATGGTPIVPRFCADSPVVLAQDILTGAAQAGSRVLVIGGGLVGSETAEFLADKGREVTVVELRDGIALDMEYKTRQMLMPKLAALGVVFLTETEVLEIGCNGNVKVKTPYLEKELSGFDTVVVALGYRPDAALCADLAAADIDFVQVGDCKKVGKIINGVWEAFQLAYRI